MRDTGNLHYSKVTSNFYYEHELHESNELLFVSFVLFVFEKKQIFSGYLKYTLQKREIIMKYTLLKCEIIMKYTLKYFFSTTYCTVKVGEEKSEKVHELS